MADTPTASTSAALPYLQEAREQGFRQFVRTIAKTFMALPISWLVIFAVTYGKVPLGPVLTWAGIFFLAWLWSVMALRKFDRDGPDSATHLVPVSIIVIVEGLLWGAMLFVLMGQHAETNAWAMVLLVGIVSIVLPSYIAYPKAFLLLLFSIWVAASGSVLLTVHLETLGQHIVLTLLCYFAALGYTIRPIAGRVLEGIRLQLLNEALTAQLQENLAIASHTADTDALTGLLNRRALNRALSELVTTGERRRTDFSLLMLDVDFFKAINDTYGHDVGDLALQHVAQCIGSQLRDGDFCARFGGEEFVVLLPGANETEAMHVAERIRQALESSPLTSPRHAITASIGLATYQEGMSGEMLLKAADSAVYQAKRNGRNQVCVSQTLATA